MHCKEVKLSTSRVPVRHKAVEYMPVKRSDDVRRLANTATACTLTIDSEAFEILASIAGKQLPPSLAAALLDGTVEHLVGYGDGLTDKGPLGLADVVGAVFGIVHFALHNGGDWSFVRIPEIPGTKTSDVFARRRGEEPWLLELKATAPLSSSVATRRRIDVCADIISQRSTARSQLTTVVVEPTGPPSVVFNAGASRNKLATGGKAIAITAIPDGKLVGLPNIAPAGKRGCPKDRHTAQFMTCTEHCLKPATTPPTVGILSLLWQQPNPDRKKKSDGGEPDSPDWTDALDAASTIQAGIWAGSQTVVDTGLLALADGLRLAVENSPTDAAVVVMSLLTATRQFSSKRARRLVFNLFGGLVTDHHIVEELQREMDWGNADQPANIEIGDISLVTDRSEQAEFRVDDGPYTGFGTLRAGSLRYACTHATLRSSAETGDGSALLSWTWSAFRNQIVRSIERDVSLFLDPTTDGEPIEIRRSEPIGSWTVGKRLVWPRYLHPFFQLPWSNAWASFDGRMSIDIGGIQELRRRDR